MKGRQLRESSGWNSGFEVGYGMQMGKTTVKAATIISDGSFELQSGVSIDTEVKVDWCHTNLPSYCWKHRVEKLEWSLQCCIGKWP